MGKKSGKLPYMTYTRSGKAVFGARARVSDVSSRIGSVLRAPVDAVNRKRGARQFRRFAQQHNRSIGKR